MANQIFGDTAKPCDLERKPFYSRFTEFERSGDNYILIGFTPGLALQAAELNELQDIYHKIDKLSNTLLSNWTLYALQNIAEIDDFTGIIWNGTIPLSPNMVSVNANTITFSPGWYNYTHDGGLNYWVHLGQQITYDDSVNGANGYIGFRISITDNFASTTTTGDIRLYDRSSGSFNTNSPGAYRIEHNIQAVEFSTNVNTTKPILEKINNLYSFMNGKTL